MTQLQKYTWLIETIRICCRKSYQRESFFKIRKYLDLTNHQLHTVAEACGYNLSNHHDALADAEACAAIALKIL